MIFKRYTGWGVGAAVLLLSIFTQNVSAARADGPCYCSTKPDPSIAGADSICTDVAKNQGDCQNLPTSQPAGFKKYSTDNQGQGCVWLSPADCVKAKQAWQNQHDYQGELTKSAAAGQNSLIRKFLPACLFTDALPTDSQGHVTGQCGSVDVFISALIGIGSAIFSIIGGVALLVFIYGGFLFILSEGNPERVKKGTDAMLAAVIGLAVAFGGYALVKFLGTAVGLTDYYKLQ